jgi:hypothetical protein
MSERAPSEAPKPRPPRSEEDREQDRLIARLQKNLGMGGRRVQAPEQTPAETKSTWEGPMSKVFGSQDGTQPALSEDAESQLDRELAAVEAIPVPETPFADVAPIELPAVSEAAVAQVVPGPEEPDAVAALEAAFNAPDAVVPEAAKTERAPRPPRAQQSHHDFHAERPATAVYRVGKSYKYAAGTEKGGKFATKEDYEKQNGSFANNSELPPDSATKHYDEVMGLSKEEAAPATPERADYEKMDTDQLAFAAAKADLLGDKFVLDQIKDVYATPFEAAYTDPDNPTLSLEDYEAAIAQFDKLVAAATDYERAKDPAHYELVDAAVERANKEPSLGEKLKGWWNKNGQPVLDKFRPSYWSERWENAIKPKIGEVVTSALNIGVDLENDSPEVIEKKQKRNRVIFMAGGAAVAIAAIAAPAFGIGFAMGGGGHHAAEALGGGGSAGHPGASVGNTLSAHDQAVAEALSPQHQASGPISEQLDQHRQMAEAANAANAAPAAPEFSVNDPGFTVSSGEGGYKLFHDLNLPDSVWDTNKTTLLQRFPDNFYSMGNGAVGINDRPLSDAAKEFINTLRS